MEFFEEDPTLNAGDPPSDAPVTSNPLRGSVAQTLQLPGLCIGTIGFLKFATTITVNPSAQTVKIKPFADRPPQAP